MTSRAKASMSARERAAKSLTEEVVRIFGWVRLRVLGTSMAPSILPGDLVSVERAKLDEVSSGEIVLFSQNGRWFVHRVVSRRSDPAMACLITRGDRLDYDDAPVTSSDLLGRVTRIDRGDRHFEPVPAVRGWKQAMSRVLRTSDFATSVYLRLASWPRFFSLGSAPCQP